MLTIEISDCCQVNVAGKSSFSPVSGVSYAKRFLRDKNHQNEKLTQNKFLIVKTSTRQTKGDPDGQRIGARDTEKKNYESRQKTKEQMEKKKKQSS